MVASPARKARVPIVLLRTGVLCAAAAFALMTLKAGIVAFAIESESAVRITQARALDPGNARLVYALAWLQSRSADPEERCRLFVEASRMNTSDPFGAGSMASACLAVVRVAEAREGAERALQLDPTTPRYRWLAASAYSLTGDSQSVLQQLRTLLTLDPNYGRAAFRLAALVSGNDALPGLMPSAHQPGLRLALCAYLADQGDFAAAAEVWHRVVADRLPPALLDAQPYLDRLIDRRQIDEAASAWTGLQSLGTISAGGATPSGAVFNGSFEHEPVGTGFDWRLRPPNGVWLDFDLSAAHSGSRSLRLQFMKDENGEYEVAAQLLPVELSRAYRLLAYARSQGVTSDSGPRLRVTDPDCPACPAAETEGTIGDTAWHSIKAEFTTGPKQRLARIALWRPRSRTFPTQIAGRFWLDSVSLSPQ